MTDDRGHARPAADAFLSDDLPADDEIVVLDYTGNHWSLIENHPAQQHRIRGFDPYNTAEKPPGKRPWQRIERR